MAAALTMGFQLSRPMTATVYVTNVGDYDTFLEATRNAGFVVGLEDWHYTKHGIKISFESNDHASAFLGAVRGLRIGDCKVVARRSRQSTTMQSPLRIMWPAPSVYDIRAAFCDTYAAAGKRAGNLQSRLLQNEILNDEREIYYDDDGDTGPFDSKAEQVDQALKTESKDGVKAEDSDVIKLEVKSEESHGFEDEKGDDEKNMALARMSTLISLPVRVDLRSSA